MGAAVGLGVAVAAGLLAMCLGVVWGVGVDEVIVTGFSI